MNRKTCKRLFILLVFLLVAFLFVNSSFGVAGSGNILIKANGAMFRQRDNNGYVQFSQDHYFTKIQVWSDKTQLGAYWVKISNANLTIHQFFTANRFNATVNAPIGTISLMQLYTHDKGEPSKVQVSQAQNWFYNYYPSGVLQVNITHASPAIITLFWGAGAGKGQTENGGEATVTVSTPLGAMQVPAIAFYGSFILIGIIGIAAFTSQIRRSKSLKQLFEERTGRRRVSRKAWTKHTKKRKDLRKRWRKRYG